MKIIFGLGNPGQKYENNRHNIGYMVVENLASEVGAKFKRSLTLGAQVAKAKKDGCEIILAKSRTFMNNSGLSARKVAARYKVPAQDVLIIYDEIDLALGFKQTYTLHRLCGF